MIASRRRRTGSRQIQHVESLGSGPGERGGGRGRHCPRGRGGALPAPPRAGAASPAQLTPPPRASPCPRPARRAASSPPLRRAPLPRPSHHKSAGSPSSAASTASRSARTRPRAYSLNNSRARPRKRSRTPPASSSCTTHQSASPTGFWRRRAQRRRWGSCRGVRSGSFIKSRTGLWLAGCRDWLELRHKPAKPDLIY
jgi:hypothetical protein